MPYTRYTIVRYMRHDDDIDRANPVVICTLPTREAAQARCEKLNDPGAHWVYEIMTLSEVELSINV